MCERTLSTQLCVHVTTILGGGYLRQLWGCGPSGEGWVLGALDTNPPLDTSPPLHPLGLAGKQKGDKTKTYSAPEGCQRYHVWKNQISILP